MSFGGTFGKSFGASGNDPFSKRGRPAEMVAKPDRETLSDIVDHMDRQGKEEMWQSGKQSPFKNRDLAFTPDVMTPGRPEPAF